MLDNAFLDVIESVRRSLEVAMLERVSAEEQLQSDVFYGDLNFDTSYALPGSNGSNSINGLVGSSILSGFGRSNPNQVGSSSLAAENVSMDLSMSWNAFSQAALRSIVIGEEPEEPPVVGIEISFRVSQLSAAPDPHSIVGLMSERPAPNCNGVSLLGPSVSLTSICTPRGDVFSTGLRVSFAEEIPLETHLLVDSSALEKVFAGIGTWAASQLVVLHDYPFAYLAN